MSVLAAERRMMEVLVAELNFAMEELTEKPEQSVRKIRAPKVTQFTQRLGTKASDSRAVRMRSK